MKVYEKPRYPTNYLFFDTETKSRRHPTDKESDCAYFWFGYSLAYRSENGQRTRLQERVHRDIKDFWDFLVSRCDKSRPLWVFAHNIIFDLTVLDAWSVADSYGISVEMPVLDDPPVILSCKWQETQIHFVDTFNYWKCSVADIGDSQGVKKLSMPKCNCLCKEWIDYCKRDVEVIARAIDNLVQWLQKNDLGPLSYTIASIALSTFRHRFMPSGSIHVHDKQEVLELERQSYHGGLTHPYFIGEVKGKVYKLDVNSLYPFCMLKKYPVKLVCYDKEWKRDVLATSMEKYGAVAEVRIQSKKDPYPLYRNKRLIEATGDFCTVLCGQELLDALDKGHVKHVFRAALYEMRDIFSKYVQYFWHKRVEYKNRGDKVGDQFCKLLLNSLYGKFGQRGVQWIDLTYDILAALYTAEGLEIPKLYEDEDNVPIFGFGVNYWTPQGFPEPLTLRCVGDSIQVKLNCGEHHESCPIIAAYVTSYARSYIRFLRGLAGRNSVYYTDTDSLFCSKVAYDRLDRAGYVDSKEIGKLKLECVANQLTVYGPKDYVIEGQRVAKGIRKDAIPCCPECGHEVIRRGVCGKCKVPVNGVASFKQLQFEHIKSIMKRDAEEDGAYIRISKVQKTLKREYLKGTIKPSGWTAYPEISDY